MKVKTSITLSKDIMVQIDEWSSGEKNRSAFIEAAVAAYIDQLRRGARNRSDLHILNEHARRINREMEDVLHYQERL